MPLDIIQMPNYDIVNLMLQGNSPNNEIIVDNAGNPGVYVRIGKQKLSDLLDNVPEEMDMVHPAFKIGGVEKDSIYIGKFQGSENGNTRIYSLPSSSPKVSITLANTINYCRNKGDGHHCITAAEWAFLALWCKKNGTLPKGNSDYGKDITENLYKAIPASVGTDGRINRVLTGTGPLTWSHDGTPSGIWDLNGNIWESCSGMRLINGELQVIPDNNAASPSCDLSSTSNEWKAINANATSWGDMFIEPNGSGTTENSVKLDFDETKWVYSTTISHNRRTAECNFLNVSCDSTIGDKAKLLLRVLAMLPETELFRNDVSTIYNVGNLSLNNSESDIFAVVRGGEFRYRTKSGVFYSYMRYTDSYNSIYFGCRPAYYE